MDTREEFGAAVQARREELGLSKAGLARTAAIDPSTITRIESGEVGVSPGLVFLLAWALELAPYELAEIAGLTEAAQRWRERGELWEPSDAMLRTRQSMGGLPIRPSSRAAVLRVLEEFVKAEAPRSDWRDRFDTAWDYATQALGAMDAMPRAAWERQVRERLMRKLFEEPD